MCYMCKWTLSSIKDHESLMIIQWEYKVHLWNDKKTPKCLSVLFVVDMWKPSLHFSLYLFSTISLGNSEFGYHFQQSWLWQSVTHIFPNFQHSWCFNELGFICKTHVCKQINVLLRPTLFISKSGLKEGKNLIILRHSEMLIVDFSSLSNNHGHNRHQTHISMRVMKSQVTVNLWWVQTDRCIFTINNKIVIMRWEKNSKLWSPI